VSHRLRVLEDRVLRVGIRGEWRRLHDKKHNDLNSSPDIMRVIKSRRITWVGHVACMGEIRGTGLSQGNLKETELLENPEIDRLEKVKMDLQ